uniref:Uncharacterized protein n=1 Tax=Sciurus vulgaris TaxID=55149 RepID=A0A8D2ARL3_SCIVU
MKEEGGMILPTPALKTEERKTKSAPQKTQAKPVGVKIPTCKITLRETFLTSPEELYRVFTTQEVVSFLLFLSHSFSRGNGLGV